MVKKAQWLAERQGRRRKARQKAAVQSDELKKDYSTLNSFFIHH
jgi:hypothetical protein